MLEQQAPVAGAPASEGDAPPIPDDVRHRIERLHDAVRDATDRCQGVLVSKSNRQRLRDALEAERLALEELGFDSYGAFVVATGIDPSMPGLERSGLAARNPEELDPWLRAQVSTALGRMVTTYSAALEAVRAELATTIAAPPHSSAAQEPSIALEPSVGPEPSAGPEPSPPVAANSPAHAHANGGTTDPQPAPVEEPTVTTSDVAAPAAPTDSVPAEPWVPPLPNTTGDLAALVATLHDAAQAMMAGVTSACADAQAAIDRLAEERRLAASEVEAAHNEAAAARAEAEIERTRAREEAEALLAAAREEADKVRTAIAQKAREAEARLARLGAEAASVAQQLDG